MGDVDTSDADTDGKDLELLRVTYQDIQNELVSLEQVVLIHPTDTDDICFHDYDEQNSVACALGIPVTRSDATENGYIPCSECFENRYGN